MDNGIAISQIVDTLSRLSASDPQLCAKITEDVIERYMTYAQQDHNGITCPVCFLSKGKISYMYPKRLRLLSGEEDVMCDCCRTRIPLTLPSKRVA